jgi:hypothetical protein
MLKLIVNQESILGIGKSIVTLPIPVVGKPDRVFSFVKIQPESLVSAVRFRKGPDNHPWMTTM